MKRIIFLALIIVGIGIMVWGYNYYKKARASENWPTANGKVLSSKVESYTSSTGTGSSRRSTRMYRPRVLYQYSVDGRMYTGSRVSFLSYSSKVRSKAQRVVDNYPPNKEVIAYYDPNSPDVAVLQPGETGGLHIPFIVGGGAIFMGFMVLISRRTR